MLVLLDSCQWSCMSSGSWGYAVEQDSEPKWWGKQQSGSGLCVWIWRIKLLRVSSHDEKQTNLSVYDVVLLCSVYIYVTENIKHSRGRYTPAQGDRSGQISGQLTGQVGSVIHNDVLGIPEMKTTKSFKYLKGKQNLGSHGSSFLNLLQHSALICAFGSDWNRQLTICNMRMWYLGGSFFERKATRQKYCYCLSKQKFQFLNVIFMQKDVLIRYVVMIEMRST